MNVTGQTEEREDAIAHNELGIISYKRIQKVANNYPLKTAPSSFS